MPAARPLRILHAPRNTAGQAGDVVAALRRLGHEVELWDDEPNVFGLAADRWLGYDGRDPHRVWAAVIEAAERFDVIHFHAGRTLVPPGWSGLPPFWDLPVYRALGRRVYVTFHGSDVRIGRIHDQMNPWSSLVEVPPQDDERIEKSLQVMRTYADRLFVVSVNYLPYVPDAEYLPRVIDLASWPVQAPAQRERPVIVHAPSRRGTKGTDLILAVLDDLAREGVGFDLRLLEGVRHAEVQETLATADVLVDNVIAGSYGIVSLEAMALGKVAVSNMSLALRAAHPEAPVVHVEPPTLRDTLRRLIGDVDERRRLAALGRPYVTRVHDADHAAARLDAVYREPQLPVSATAMPDWMSFRGPRRIELLEARLAHAEVELGRSRLREAELRAQLGLPDGRGIVDGARQLARRVLPVGARSGLARLRRR